MFYQSKPFTCSYYANRTAQYILFYLPENDCINDNINEKVIENESTPNAHERKHQDPSFAVKVNGLSSELTRHGFRRNNSMFYRPHCQSCDECQSLRVNVNAFICTKRFKRIVKKNKDVRYQIIDAVTTEEHFALFQAYQQNRHQNGVMNYGRIAEYHQNLIVSPITTKLVEFRLNNQLIAVAIIDIVDDGLSATYTYFDPQFSNRSLGTFAILTQIQLSQSLQKPWLYLGYWLRHHDKMRYKTDFKPYQIYRDKSWQ